MAKKQKIPATPALRMLRAAGISFEIHPYAYVPRGGARASADALGVDLHAVIKTLVLERSPSRSPLLMLMHGDLSVSTRELSRSLGTKNITPCDPKTAQRHTGYQFGGTSPFGTRKQLPVYVEQSILALPRIWINGGKRGLLVSMTPADLQQVLAEFTAVSVSRPLSK